LKFQVNISHLWHKYGNILFVFRKLAPVPPLSIDTTIHHEGQSNICPNAQTVYVLINLVFLYDALPH